MNTFVRTAQQGDTEQLQRRISQLRDIEYLLMRLAGPPEEELPHELQEALDEVHDEFIRCIVLEAEACRKQAPSSPD